MQLRTDTDALERSRVSLFHQLHKPNAHTRLRAVYQKNRDVQLRALLRGRAFIAI
ncbi:hypothetical protein B0H14DRAFT_3430383 [Mycena olivaceomarginata]|nr:hypothetical protein B0H14DRAFT_3430383 [Mycena olivaceomarginata]